MSKLLLLVQTEADVAHLDAAAKAIQASAITGIWVVFSPAITVNASEAASKLDGEIETLRTAEKQAAERSDYAAAAGYKEQRDGKALDRAKALRDAWKTASPEDRKKKTESIFVPFAEPLKRAGLNVKVTGHSDHYDREQWVAMLNSLSGAWFKEFVPGSFLIGWPEAAGLLLPVGKTNIGAVLDKQHMAQALVAAENSVKLPPAPKTRREELEALHPMKLGPLMRSLGLDAEGKTRAEKIEVILAAEAAPAQEPVEAY